MSVSTHKMDRLKEIKKRTAAAMSGPWEAKDVPSAGLQIMAKVPFHAYGKGWELKEDGIYTIFRTPQASDMHATVAKDGTLTFLLAYEDWVQFPCKEWDDIQSANAQFLAHAREDVEWLIEELKKAEQEKARLRQKCDCNMNDRDTLQVNYDKLKKEKAPLYTDRIKDLEKHIKKMSHRRCFECKHEDYYVLNTLPHCKCSKCGSADTRLIKETK